MRPSLIVCVGLLCCVGLLSMEDSSSSSDDLSQDDESDYDEDAYDSQGAQAYFSRLRSPYITLRDIFAPVSRQHRSSPIIIANQQHLTIVLAVKSCSSSVIKATVILPHVALPPDAIDIGGVGGSSYGSLRSSWWSCTILVFRSHSAINDYPRAD